MKKSIRSLKLNKKIISAFQYDAVKAGIDKDFSVKQKAKNKPCIPPNG
ncbi:hypothetical protein GWK08_13505 [Leptobacterium flavescens]|uniref:Uncharacterized protein n=1 Tax=Leptobacterium flavescens TaxID=472055 RepID=A0A6P0UMJ4_9FLAO|nr:hypothetical protein [Leptobacterium flavescens]NER14464.1 hypothetical protein [Leptobacterium flavescens]